MKDNINPTDIKTNGEAALAGLYHFRCAVSYLDLLDYYETINYVVGGKTPKKTVPRDLCKLYESGKHGIDRIKKGRGFLYFLTKFGPGDDVVPEKEEKKPQTEEPKKVKKVAEKIKVDKKVVEEVTKKVIVKPTPKPLVVEDDAEISDKTVIYDQNELQNKFYEATGLEFSEFYKKYRPKLVYYLAKYTKNNDIAEDFADEAFTQALLKIDNYNSEKSQIHTWVYKIAENFVKKDYKDQQKLSVVSLDKENDDNLNLINVIPNGQQEEKNNIEEDGILTKKAELVKEAIHQLPEKYKRVMVLREIENKPYLDIAETCVKEWDYHLKCEEKILPSVFDFINLKILNHSDSVSYVNITYNEEGVEQTIQFEIKPYRDFNLNRGDIDNITDLEVVSTEFCSVYYKTTTNLSTIKSQISKGRQLIQSMVTKKFKILEDQGLSLNESFKTKKEIDIFEGDESFEQDSWF